MIYGAGKWIAAVGVTSVAIACSGGSTERQADTTPHQPPPAAVSTTSSRLPRKADDCPATGEWALCSIEKRLRRSGFVATRLEEESPSRPGFSIKPVVYSLGRGRLEVFLYDNATAMNRDIANIDTLSVTPRGTTSEWPSTPALIRNGNLAAVYMDQTARQAERLVLALTAGAPSGR